MKYGGRSISLVIEQAKGIEEAIPAPKMVFKL